MGSATLVVTPAFLLVLFEDRHELEPYSPSSVTYGGDEDEAYGIGVTAKLGPANLERNGDGSDHQPGRVGDPARGPGARDRARRGVSEHLGYPPGRAPPGGAGNVRNGSTAKRVQTELGTVKVRTPRDRNGSFGAAAGPQAPDAAGRPGRSGAGALTKEQKEIQAGREFLGAHAASIVACDLFTVETAFLRRYYVLFFIELHSRRVHLAGSAEHPSGHWVAQQARNLAVAGRLESAKFLIHDRDSKFVASFDEVFRSEGVRVVLTRFRAPQANAHAERFVRTVRAECLDWLLILGPRQLDRSLRVFVEHYNHERPHRALGRCPPARAQLPPPHRPPVWRSRAGIDSVGSCTSITWQLRDGPGFGTLQVTTARW